MKKIYLLVLLFIAAPLFSHTYFIFNVPSTLFGFRQIGVETSLGKKITFQGDILGSYWNSLNGAPFKTLMVFAEGRYHFREKYNGLYIGGHIGGSKFTLKNGAILIQA